MVMGSGCTPAQTRPGSSADRSRRGARDPAWGRPSRCRSRSPPERTEMTAQQPNPELNRRILIVDDNRAIHDDFQKILHSCDEPSELDDLEAMILGSEAPTEHHEPFVLESAFQ